MALKRAIPSKDALRTLRQLAFPSSRVAARRCLSDYANSLPSWALPANHQKEPDLPRTAQFVAPKVDIYLPAPWISSSSTQSTRPSVEDLTALAIDQICSSLQVSDTCQNGDVVAVTESKRRLEQCWEYVYTALKAGNDHTAAKVMLWLSVYLVDACSPPKLKEVTTLHRIYGPYVSQKYAIPMQQELLRFFLGRKTPVYEMVAIVADAYRPRGGGEGPPLTMYLEYCCHQGKTLDDQYLEVNRIFRGLQLASLPLDIDLMLPFLRTASYTDDTERAYELLKTTCQEFRLQPSTKIIEALIQGFSRTASNQGDWDRVDEMITMSHNLGYSRRKFDSHSHLVLTAAIRYAQIVKPVRLYDFVAYHMQENGLVPNQYLSAWMFLCFFAAGRFDLAQKWAYTLYSCFPGLHSLPRNIAFAHDLADMWAIDETSCTEILAMCKILTHGAVRNPFGDDLGLLIREALCADLCSRAWRSGLSIYFGNIDGPQNMHSLLDLIETRLSVTFRQDRDNLSKTLMHNALWDQLHAARDTVLLLEDYGKFLNTHLWIRALPKTYDTGYARSATYLKQMTSNVDGRKWLVQDTIDEKLETFVSMCTDASVPSHVIAKRMVACLSTERRYAEASLLLQKISKLPNASDIFNNSLINDWISVACRSRTWFSLRDALWYCVSSTSTIARTPTQVLLIVSHALEGFATPRPRHLHPRHHEEMRYLLTRLFRRWWMQRGCRNLTRYPNSAITALYEANVILEQDVLGKDQDRKSINER